MNKPNAAEGFLEVAHTADRAVQVWSRDLRGLLRIAAHAMFALQEIKLDPGAEYRHTMSASGHDREDLLVNFLSSLLSESEITNRAFFAFDFEIIETRDDQAVELDKEYKLFGEITGGNILSKRGHIKAVTYSGLEIIESVRGLEATIVFDV